jgi:glycosyltransferase involved in cell wall biosynthesis
VLTYGQLIDHGTTGLLASNAAELADCCLRMLHDPEEARAMATRAQAMARQYDWPQVAQVLLDELNQHVSVGAAS